MTDASTSKTARPQEARDLESAPILRVAGLAKRYGRIDVLQDVSFDVPGGSVVALLGANGAGKTTTLKCILGVISFRGAIDVAGVDVLSHGKQARRHLGYVPQTPALPDGDTCEQALAFLAEIKGADKDRVPELLDLVSLTPQLKVKVGHLSGGMRQRLALAAALLADPPLLLLDEPTASLDVESRRDLQQLLRRLRDEGKTIILSTHFFDHLDELADRAVILDGGRVAYDGSFADLVRRTHANRYIVNLNGNAPTAFLDALRSAGIPDDRVERADVRWEEILLAATNAPDSPAAVEERP
jgi:ABC-type multidrug transport system ATPase subunit